ncbi:MAG: Trm112 family protein [Hyphomonadaceae bacterium]
MTAAANEEIESEAGEAGVDPRLLEVLICPVTRAPLTYDREANELISRAAGLAYPIRNGVPVMLRDEARDLGADK